jgi:FkbM family methyltransferase
MKLEKMKIAGLHSIRGHHFYADLISSDCVVLDLGSHLGQFSQEISNISGCKCYAVEALPALYEKIAETPLIRKFNYAISSSNQPIDFCVTENQEANHIAQITTDDPSQKITVEGISIEKFLSQQNIQGVDLMKVDIEGAEIELFKSMSDETIGKIKQITIEFHDFIFNIGKEVEEIKQRLKALGFTIVVFSRQNNGDVLCINKKLCKIPFFRFIYIIYFAKYIRGSIRMIERFLRPKVS